MPDRPLHKTVRGRWLGALLALGWGWFAGMAVWTLLALGLTFAEGGDGWEQLGAWLLLVALFQTLFMLPGVGIFLGWYRLVPPERSNWSSALPLGLLTGPLVMVFLLFLEKGPRVWIEPAHWAFGALSLPVSLTTFLVGARYRRPRLAGPEEQVA
jgi:hypothetical protein